MQTIEFLRLIVFLVALFFFYRQVLMRIRLGHYRKLDTMDIPAGYTTFTVFSEYMSRVFKLTMNSQGMETLLYSGAESECLKRLGIIRRRLRANQIKFEHDSYYRITIRKDGAQCR